MFSLYEIRKYLDMSGEEEKNSENGKDSAEMIQEMRYNEVIFQNHPNIQFY